LKRNISCDAHLLNELLETDVPWDDAIVVSAGKLETVGFPEWTAQFSAWKRTGKDSSEACAIACQNCALYSVFLSGMKSHSKIAQFNWECIMPLIFVGPQWSTSWQPPSASNWGGSQIIGKFVYPPCISHSQLLVWNSQTTWVLNWL